MLPPRDEARRALFADSFTPLCKQVIEDPFHLLLGYSSAVSTAHPLRREFLAEMTNAFFVREVNDKWLDDESNRTNFEKWKVLQPMLVGTMTTDWCDRPSPSCRGGWRKCYKKRTLMEQ